MRLILAEDSALLRTCMARALSGVGFEIAGLAGSEEELLSLVEKDSVDVVVAGTRMPPTHTDEGIRAAVAIREGHPDVGILVLSAHPRAQDAARLLCECTHSVGYLGKDRVSNVEELGDAIRRIGRGESVIDPEVVRQLIGAARQPNSVEALTDRERGILSLMADGRSNQGIALRLGITAKTLETHIASIFAKLGLAPGPDDHRRVLAVLAFLRS